MRSKKSNGNGEEDRSALRRGATLLAVELRANCRKVRSKAPRGGPVIGSAVRDLANAEPCGKCANCRGADLIEDLTEALQELRNQEGFWK